MPLTGLKISLNEYKRLIEKDINRAKKDSIYGGLLDNLSKLTDMTQKYYTYNADGKYPTLYAKDYKDLIKVYSALAKSCNDFLDNDRKKDRLEEKRVNIIKNLFSCVQKDLKGLVKAEDFEEMFPLCREVTEQYRQSCSRVLKTGQYILRLMAPLL